MNKRFAILVLVLAATVSGWVYSTTTGNNTAQQALLELFCDACGQPKNRDIRDLVASTVTLSDAQTITGVKTFSSASNRGTASSLNVPFILSQSGAAVSAPADTNEDTLATVTVPAGAMGANGMIRCEGQVNVTNNANNKTFRVRFGGAAGDVFMQLSPVNATAAQFQTIILNANSASAQSGASTMWANSGTAFSDGGKSGTQATASAVTLLITVQKASGADTAQLAGYSCVLYSTGT